MARQEPKKQLRLAAHFGSEQEAKLAKSRKQSASKMANEQEQEELKEKTVRYLERCRYILCLISSVRVCGDARLKCAAFRRPFPHVSMLQFALTRLLKQNT